MKEEIADGFGRILADICPPAVVREIEQGGSHRKLWEAIEESGYLDALVPDASGGVGLSAIDALPIIELAGRHAVPVPLAETVLIRGILAAAGQVPPTGSIAFGGGASREDGQLSCDVVNGSTADNIVVTIGAESRCLPRMDVPTETRPSEMDLRMQWPIDAWQGGVALPSEVDIVVVEAFCRASQIVGALVAIFDATVRFANDREQFGRPIGKFQAIQHQLSVMAEHVFAARMAAEMGAPSAGLVPDRLRTAIAKARTSEAAVVVAAHSHAIHGAIGFTEEYDLQLLTRRLHVWRQSAGTEAYWHGVAGRVLVERPAGMVLDVLRDVTAM